jgi:hypothetical protein
MEKIKCNNHEIKNWRAEFLGSKAVQSESVKEEITEIIKIAGTFYQLIKYILCKWVIFC